MKPLWNQTLQSLPPEQQKQVATIKWHEWLVAIFELVFSYKFWQACGKSFAGGVAKRRSELNF
jgi:hypothetical protein